MIHAYGIIATRYYLKPELSGETNHCRIVVLCIQFEPFGRFFHATLKQSFGNTGSPSFRINICHSEIVFIFLICALAIRRHARLPHEETLLAVYRVCMQPLILYIPISISAVLIYYIAFIAQTVMTDLMKCETCRPEYFIICAFPYGRIMECRL